MVFWYNIPLPPPPPKQWSWLVSAFFFSVFSHCNTITTGWSFHHQPSSFSKPLQFLLRLHNRKVRNKKVCDLNPMHNSDVIAEIVFWHNILQGTPPSPNNVNWSQFSYSYARLVLLWQNKEGQLVLISSIKCCCCVSWLNWQSAMRHGRCRQFQFCKWLWVTTAKRKVNQ